MVRVSWIALLLLTFSLVVFGQHQPIFAEQTLSQDVLNAYAEVRERTEIPARLPSTIPLNAPAALDISEVWARVLRVVNNEYIVSFDRAEDCSDVIECSFGSIQGTRLSGDETPLSEVFRHAPDYDGQKGPVTLADDIQGYYAPAEPYLYDPATVIWEEGGIRYRAVLYMAAKEDVVAMANSAIQGG
jgi:hypothetical protein